MAKKYTLTKIKKMAERRASRVLDKNEFLTLYGMFLGEFTNIAKIRVPEVVLENPVANKNKDLIFELPEDFLRIEAVITNDVYGINLVKTSPGSMHDKSNNKNEIAYYIIEDKLVIPHYYGYGYSNSVRTLRLFYFKNLMHDFEEEIGKNTEASALNLDDVEYALDNIYVDVCSLYIAHQYYEIRKEGDTASYLNAKYLMKRQEYIDEVASIREERAQTEMIIERELV